MYSRRAIYKFARRELLINIGVAISTLFLRLIEKF